MAVKVKFGSSFSGVSPYLSSPFQRNPKLKLNSRTVLLDSSQFDRGYLRNNREVKPFQLTYAKPLRKTVLSKSPGIPFAASEDQESNTDLEPNDSELEEMQQPSAERIDPQDIISEDHNIEGAGGKPGFISFYRQVKKNEETKLVPSPTPGEGQNSLLWFMGPSVLVASFIFPSLYLRRIISTIFEDSLLTDFLILFFTEALFYCGVAVFLLLIDRLRRPMNGISATSNPKGLAPHLGHRISSVAVLVLSLLIPTVTMGFVWPWTGPAASATLAPYLVGIVVQFAFEQYARHVNTPAWPAIPIIFQVYRLHQLNRAAQLVTALSFTIRGAEVTSHNLAINGSLTTLLNVLQFLGIICIWSLSSFVMRYFPSVAGPPLRQGEN